MAAAGGRFDRGPTANATWFAQTAELEHILERFGPRGDVLELACGTGLWTRHLVRYADRVTAVDGAAEVLASPGRSSGPSHSWDGTAK